MRCIITRPTNIFPEKRRICRPKPYFRRPVGNFENHGAASRPVTGLCSIYITEIIIQNKEVFLLQMSGLQTPQGNLPGRFVGFLCTILAGALYGIMLSVLVALAQVVAEAATPQAVTLGEVPRLKQWHEDLDGLKQLYFLCFFFRLFQVIIPFYGFNSHM